METVGRNVKRWQGGDQYLRWVGSGLLWAESRWNRVHGYRELPVLVKELELAVIKGIPLRHATAGMIGGEFPSRVSTKKRSILGFFAESESPAGIRAGCEARRRRAFSAKSCLD